LNKLKLLTLWVSASAFALVAFPLEASQKTTQKSTPPTAVPVTLLTRTTTRRESQRFGFAGTVTIVGAPKGSVTVEGWSRSEVELVADVELKGPSEEDLDKIATVNNFAFDVDMNHISILTTGTHDRAYMKRVAKTFPKTLMNFPWKIDYRLKVPANTDLEINAGHGPVKVSGVEGAIRISATESETALSLTGGIVSATVTAGVVNLTIPARSWRGGGADIRVATGVLNVELLPGFSADIDAEVLRTGKIVNDYEGLLPREKPGITERTVRARAGAGGPSFKFTVVDGVVNIRKAGG
jgi:hypothetical protein